MSGWAKEYLRQCQTPMIAACRSGRDAWLRFLARPLTARAMGSSWLPPLLLLTAAFVVYGNSLLSPFVFEEFGDMPDGSPERHPLVSLARAACSWVGGSAVWPFHAYSIVLHAFAAWLVFRIGNRLIETSPPVSTGGSARIFSFELTARVVAFLAAMLFLVHPGLHGAVNHPSATGTLQAAVLYLAAFLVYLASLDASTAPAKALQALAFVSLYVASLLTKMDGATLPMLLALHAVLMQKGGTWAQRLASNKAALLLACATLGAVVALQPAAAPPALPTQPWFSYFLTQTRAWVFYLAWIFMPWGYAVQHMSFRFSESFHEPRVLASAGFLLLATRAAIRTSPIFAFCWGAYILALLPSSSVLARHEPIHETRTYVSYCFAFIALVYGALYVFARLQRVRIRLSVSGRQSDAALVTKQNHGQVLGWSIALVFSALALGTMAANRVWRSPLSVWQNAVAQDPAGLEARNKLALVYMSENKPRQALRELDDCVDLAKDYPPCLITESRCHLLLGEHDTALAYAQRCNSAAGGKNLTCIKLALRISSAMDRQTGEAEQAPAWLALEPATYASSFAKGTQRINEKEWGEAQAEFILARFLRPGDANALYNLAWVEMQIPDYELARRHWKEFLKTNPTMTTAWTWLKLAAERLGDKPLADECAAKLAKLGSK